MKFPNLETMVMYGIYTVKDLIMYSQNKLVKRNIKTLNECTYCSFVYSGNVCNNCNDIKNNSLV
jgi:recombinational DNA repair protein RecR